MPSSDLPFTLSVLVPVLFIVVVEITGIARNVDLIANLQSDSPNRHTAGISVNNIITYLPKFRRGQQIPAFGHFGTLHAVNVTILIYGVWIVNYGLDGAGRFILSMAVLIILALLPVLEVDEYREIRRKGVDPISHKIHGVGTFSFGGTCWWIRRSICGWCSALANIVVWSDFRSCSDSGSWCVF